MGSTRKTTILVFVISLASAVLGFGRELYIAYKFGASGITDAFYVALIVPEMVASWISGALTNSLIPVLKHEKNLSTGSAKRLVTSVFWSGMILLFVLTCITFVLRSYIITSLAPGFSQQSHDEAVKLLAVMSGSIVFYGLSGVLWGAHNALENFSYPAIVGVIYNFILIVTAVCLSNFIGADALAVGLIAGVFGRFLIQFIPLIKRGYISIPLTLWHPAMKKMIRAVFPIFISSGVTSLNLIVDRILASDLPAGQISDLNYASKIGLLPAHLIGASLAATLYTRFVTYSLNKDNSSLYRITVIGLSWSFFIGMLIGVVFTLFPTNIVEVLYHHGSFTLSDVLIASRPLLIYGLFAPFYLMPQILTHFFYARNENLYVLIVSFIAVATNIVGSLILVNKFGINGLVIANGVSYVAYVIIMLLMISFRLKWKISSIVGYTLHQSMPPALSFVLGTVIVYEVWHSSNSFTLLSALSVAISLTFGFMCLICYSYAFKLNEISKFIRYGLAKSIRFRTH